MARRGNVRDIKLTREGNKISVDIYLQGFILQIRVAEATCALKRYHNHSSGVW